MQRNVCVVNSSLEWEPFLRADNVLLVISAENQVQWRLKRTSKALLEDQSSFCLKQKQEAKSVKPLRVV